MPRTFSVEFELQRDISEYEPSTHFMERLKYRKNPEPSKEIAQEVVEEGEVYSTHEPDRIFFEKKIKGGGHWDSNVNIWRVLAAINEEAFYNEDAYHTLLTIYAKKPHNVDHKEVFEIHG